MTELLIRTAVFADLIFLAHNQRWLLLLRSTASLNLENDHIYLLAMMLMFYIYVKK